MGDAHLGRSQVKDYNILVNLNEETKTKERKPAQQRDYPANYYENADTHPIRKAGHQ